VVLPDLDAPMRATEIAPLLGSSILNFLLVNSGIIIILSIDKKMNFINLPSAIRSVRSIGDNVKALDLSVTSAIKVEKPETDKPASRKDAEKKVKKISSEKEADPLMHFIECEPSKKDVHEYFKSKIAKLNEL